MANEPVIRIGVFLAVLIVMAVWELASPRRRQEIPRVIRWSNNIGVVVIDSILVRLAFPILAVELALMMEGRGWGLFNLITLPGWVVFIITLIALDFIIYLQHVLFHAVPLLWRLHRMHHSDLEFDVTTALRFHPLEIVVSMVIKLAAVAILGLPAIAVLVFEVLLNATAMFNHSNIHIPGTIDRVLRLFLVTPDMHRVHHSVKPEEANTNFGFNLPWWDRLCGTYRAQPKDGHKMMLIGVSQFRAIRELWLDRMLLQPLRKDSSNPPKRPNDTTRR